MIDHGALGTPVLGLGSDPNIGRRHKGRIVVEPDLSVPGHPEVLVVGDMAAATRPGGAIAPAVAQGAIQDGRHAARVISARLRGKPSPEFRYRDIGELAMVGRFRVVARLPLISFAGALAWLVWLGVHLLPEWLPESPAGQPALGLEPLHAHAGAG